MASEAPRSARQLFLRGLAAAFLAAFASLYVQLPGEPAEGKGGEEERVGALHMPRGALALPGCAQSKSEVLAGASGEGRVSGGRRAVSRLVTLRKARARQSAASRLFLPPGSEADPRPAGVNAALAPPGCAEGLLALRESGLGGGGRGQVSPLSLRGSVRLWVPLQLSPGMGAGKGLGSRRRPGRGSLSSGLALGGGEGGS